jgi:2-C-methyl-D-erythritol 4-phosphate cytidylyltransferase
MEVYVVIVAGGYGKRMGSDTPKQFLLLNGKPILMHTIERFSKALSNPKILLVLPENQFEYWRQLIKQFNFDISHQLVAGGAERFFSVKNALQHIPHNFTGTIAVHDGVRPLVSEQTIINAIDLAQAKGNAIPAIDLTDSIREVENGTSHHRDRTRYKLIQTPQCFNAELLRKAYHQDFCEFFTDDASVVERAGISINLVKGNPENIKITRPIDIQISEALFKNL